MADLKIIFFWDYDTQWGADRSRSGGGRKDWGPLEFKNSDTLLDLHAEYDIPACFAVVGAAALPGERPYHDPLQIKRIFKAGHEIASHSMRHDWLPGLNPKELRQTLKESKDALEQCIGNEVTAFVPPWNEPFDCIQRLSISLSERLSVKSDRTDVYRLCEALKETGYKFTRISYRPLHQRAGEFLLNRRLDNPVFVEEIQGVKSVRLNSSGGFKEDVKFLIEKNLDRPGIIVVYGHPHSIQSGNSQDLKYLIPLMRYVAAMKTQKKINTLLPREL